MTGHDPGQEQAGDRTGAEPASGLPERPGGHLGERPDDQPLRQRRKWPGAVIAIVAVAAVVLGGLQYLPMLLSGSTETDPAPPPAATAIPQPSASPPSSGTENGGGSAPFTATGFLRMLNEALADADRERFFELVGPGAVDGLNLWWDNMATLGMSGAGLSVESGTLDGLGPGGSADLTIRLGAITLGTPRAGDDSEYADAGQYLVAAARYRITISVSAAGEGVISGWRPTDPVKPWDQGRLAAVQTEHVLVASDANEAELLEEFAGAAEEPASWVLDRYADAEHGSPIDRFTLFLTEDPERAGTWFDTGDHNDELAGFTIPLLRLGEAPGLHPRIATDEETQWGSTVVIVGPGGLDSPEAFRSLTAHELTHAVDFAWLPVPQDRSRVISEGWAEYLQELWDSSGEFAPPGSWRAERIEECLADGWGYPSDDAFDTDGADIFCAYALSASVYAYAAERGVDPFELARQARSSGQSLIEVSEHLAGPDVAQAGWEDWVHSTYG
ncbi:hypothetical protein [Ruania zhangjianzhongii]|uniref:hypothetical protein n=1 Tax=Ruania zhangjianzhongii TaxID=2603206 RepID=UPI0011C91955|nr:hypothetical protein [Ruania zhangjianzhongii]